MNCDLTCDDIRLLRRAIQALREERSNSIALQGALVTIASPGPREAKDALDKLTVQIKAQDEQHSRLLEDVTMLDAKLIAAIREITALSE